MSYIARLSFNGLPPCAIPELEACEAALGVILPEEYRQFLLVFNGGHFTNGAEYLLGESTELDPQIGYLDVLDGVYGADSPFDLRNRRRAYGFDKAAPEEFLPIGSNTNCELTCISLTGSDRGSVWNWTGEPWTQQTPSREFLNFVSIGFRTFWESLRDRSPGY